MKKSTLRRFLNKLYVQLRAVGGLFRYVHVTRAFVT